MRRPIILKKMTPLIIAVSIIILSSCHLRTVYYQYHSTPVQGWEKNDTLLFDVPPMAEAGNYHSILGLRISKAFPFTDLYLVVEQTVLPSMTSICDTVKCNIANEDGRLKTHGVSYYQYQFPITDIKLMKGDSIHISVRHCMKRDILPGVSDIGIRIRR